MSATRETTIWCDGELPGGHECQVWYQSTGNAMHVRNSAKSRGWVRRKGFDLCPAHAGQLLGKLS